MSILYLWYNYNILFQSLVIPYFTLLQGLPIVDDGNSHEYFCALRLLIDSKATDQYKLFPQSARTRCVRPLISKINGLGEGYAKWNEIFIFEVPEKVGRGL